MIDIISRTVDVLKKKPANGYEEKYARDCSVLLAEIERLKEDLEIERIRLAACGVAALANTEETVKQRLAKDNQYYSASYGDVCDAVDREMTCLIENAGLKEYSTSRDESIAVYRAEIKELKERLRRIEVIEPIGNGERNEYHDGWNECVDAIKKARDE